MGSVTVGWFRTWWLRVPTPREFSVLYTMLYLVALVAGVQTLATPPVTISTALGSPLYIMSIGVMMIVGSVVAMIGGASRAWRTERLGLWFMASAGVIYSGTVVALQFMQPGSRHLQLAWIVFGLGAFVVRWLMIRRFQYQPWG